METPGFWKRVAKRNPGESGTFVVLIFFTPQKSIIDTKHLPFLKGVTFSKPSFRVSMLFFRSVFQKFWKRDVVFIALETKSLAKIKPIMGCSLVTHVDFVTGGRLVHFTSFSLV